MGNQSRGMFNEPPCPKIRLADQLFDARVDIWRKKCIGLARAGQDISAASKEYEEMIAARDALIERLDPDNFENPDKVKKTREFFAHNMKFWLAYAHEQIYRQLEMFWSDQTYMAMMENRKKPLKKKIETRIREKYKNMTVLPSFQEFLERSERIEQQMLGEWGPPRLFKLAMKHDYGVISAERDAKNRWWKGKSYTELENKKRTLSLQAKLRSRGYGLVPLWGVAKEGYQTPGQAEVARKSFLVFDARDRGRLKKDLMELGEEFGQDCVIHARAGERGGVLIGTTLYPSSPKYREEQPLKTAVFGESGEVLSRVDGRPLTFLKIGGAPPADPDEDVFSNQLVPDGKVPFIHPPGTAGEARGQAHLAGTHWRKISDSAVENRRGRC